MSTEIIVLENFINTVKREATVWTLSTENGEFPVIQRTKTRKMAVPFWSSQANAFSQVENYPQCDRILAIPLSVFMEEIVSEFSTKDIYVGADWIGQGYGYDIEPFQAKDVFSTSEEVRFDNIEADFSDLSSFDFSSPAPVDIIPTKDDNK